MRKGYLDLVICVFALGVPIDESRSQHIYIYIDIYRIHIYIYEYTLRPKVGSIYMLGAFVVVSQVCPSSKEAWVVDALDFVSVSNVSEVAAYSGRFEHHE